MPTRGLCIALVGVLFAGGASAANPLCTGACASDGVTPCGAPTDCGGGACDFPDACLPGGAFAIRSVVEESALLANDYTQYISASITAEVRDGALHWSNTAPTAVLVGPWLWTRVPDYTANPLPVTLGQRYYFSARMLVPEGGSGHFIVLLSDGDPQSGVGSPEVYGPPVGPADWQSVGFAFTPTVAQTYYFQIYGSDPTGTGDIAIKDFALYELDDYGVYARVKLLSPNVDATVRDTFIIRKANVYYPGAPFMHTDLLAGQFSAWLPVHTWFGGMTPSYRNLFGLEVREADGTTRLSGVELQIQVAWLPDENAVLFDRTRVSPAGRVGLVLPDQLPAPSDITPNTLLVADLIPGDRARLAAWPGYALPRQPKRYWMGTVVNDVSLFDDPSAVSDVYPLFSELGLNVVPVMYELAPSDIATAAAAGLDKVIVHAESILAPHTYTPGDYDLVALESAAVSNTAALGPLATLAPLPPDPRDVLVIMGDEIGGLPFSGPLYAQAFHEYLAARGFVPADFGGAIWDDVTPSNSAAGRPNPLTDPVAAKLYYWRLRFWNEATAQAYALGRQELIAAGRDYSVVYNSGLPSYPYYRYGIGTEFQTMAAAGAVSAMFVEGFLAYNDWCRAEDLGAYADYFAAQARPHDLPMAAYLHTWKGIFGHKLLTLAARGFRYFNFYSYGPFDLSTGDGRGGLESNGWELANVAQGADVLGRSEDMLFGLTRPISSVAMLATQSDGVWGDESGLNADELGWHLALQHAGIAADFIVEEHTAQELAGREILMVMRRHVSDAAFAAVQSWVEAGGHLVLGRDLPTRNEYGAEVPERATWLGLNMVEQPPVTEQTVSFTAGAGTVDVLQHGVFSHVEGTGSVVATYPGGGPAARSRSVGSGTLSALGFDLGHEYAAPMRNCDASRTQGMGSYPEGYPTAVRQAITALASPSTPPAVVVSDPLVEAHRLEGATASAVVLLDYNPVAVTSVEVTVSDISACAQLLVAGTTLAPEPFEVVHVPIDRFEVLAWETCPPEPEPEPTPGPGLHVIDGCGCDGSGDASLWMLAAWLGAWLVRRRATKA